MRVARPAGQAAGPWGGQNGAQVAPLARRGRPNLPLLPPQVADFTEPSKGGKGGGPAPVGRRELTPALRQKLIMHVLALALMIGDGTLVASAIAGALELTPERCSFYLKQLGCKVKVSGSGEAKVRTAILDVPLTFPKTSQGPTKGR